MRRLFVIAALLLALPARAVSIDWVPVGDPGNDPDDTGYGSASCNYLISKYAFPAPYWSENHSKASSVGVPKSGIYQSASLSIGQLFLQPSREE